MDRKNYEPVKNVARLWKLIRALCDLLMNRLPNYENAFIDSRKLTEYCLNANHPYGKEKAAVFQTVLGVGINEAEILEHEIHAGLALNECVIKSTDTYGVRYTVTMKVCIFERYANLTTGWIILNNENFPRMTTCYIRDRKL